MNLYPHSKISYGLAGVALLCIAAIQPAALQAQSCGGQIPGRHVPGPPPNHDPAAPDVDLWLPMIFRPGLTGLSNRQLPVERDSTTWDSLRVPGCSTGEEIFQGLEVAGDYLYAVYNAGFSIWDISGANAENPERIKVRDGWSCGGSPCNVECGSFLAFPMAGEIDFLTEDIAVLPGTGGVNVYIAVSASDPVGLSLWRFNTVTEGLTAVYQDTTRVSRQVRLAEVADSLGGSTVYAFTSDSNGLAVYDMTRAMAIGPCLEETGSDCPGVKLGDVATISTGRYLDVMQQPTGELLIATTDGNVTSQGLQLVQLNDPSNPGTVLSRFNGLHERTFGTALFNYEGNDYLAALERDGALNVIKIFNINACSAGPCASSFTTPVYEHGGVPPRLSAQFLTYSTSNGSPFLYYGLFGGFGGPKVEQLLNLTTLGRTSQNITEMTDGSPTYFDTCDNSNIGYWGWYYPGNEYGLNNFSPRIGKFDSDSNFFYRAAGGVLDVHVWEAGIDPLDPGIVISVSDPDPLGLYWMGDEITFEGEGTNTCNPGGMWTWTATTPPEVDAVTVSEIGNQVTYRFECNATSRCDDAVVTVSGTNSDPSCAGADLTVAAITVKDPMLEITSITPDSGIFTQCIVVTFEAELLGRGPVDFAWNVNGVEEQAGVVPEEDLSTAMLSFDWDTTTVTFGEIFSDGFESGDASAWSGGAGRRRGTFPVTIELALDSGNTVDSVAVDLTPVTGDPTFEIPAIDSSTMDSATFDFEANTVVGTVSEWTWELEDDNGTSLCTFGVDTDVPCTIKTGEAITHTWVLQTGDRRVDVIIGNCQTTTTAEASTTVMVVSAVELEITTFKLDRLLSDGDACDINADCIFDLICTCFVNETVFFEVESSGEPDFYDFDWDGNGSFEDANNPTTGTEFTNVYPTPIGQIVPAVRARRGATPPAERDLAETLDIQP